MLDCQFCIYTSKGPVIIMNQLKQLKYFYNSLFKVSHSHPIHTCFPIIASRSIGDVHTKAVNVFFSYFTKKTEYAANFCAAVFSE